MHRYKTITDPFQFEIPKIKKSRFIGYAIPIQEATEVRLAIDKLRQEHPSASHWCYAYKIGLEKTSCRSNDDGEPNNSAGKPILGQIQSFQLTNVLLVVVRYYGGVKLGVGGLISAYKESAKSVLINSIIIEKEIVRTLSLQFKYDLLSKVMRMIKKYQLEILNQSMEMECIIKLGVPSRLFPEVKENLTAIYGLKLEEL